MDLETENKIASILLKEAAELRRQAQKEGALAYLKEPTLRYKPNSRFLTATVRGVQQANRIVEVNEMWRLREKQIELESRMRESTYKRRATKKDKILEPCKKKKNHVDESTSLRDEGLRDDEVEEFLNSRVKRGRGTVGSRMDETGPYPHHHHHGYSSKISTDEDVKRYDIVLGPERPSFLKKTDEGKDRDTKASIGSRERCHKKHKSKDKSRHKKSERH